MNLFKEIQEFQPLLPGWCTPEKAMALAAAVVALRCRVSVEIGLFGGSSFFPIAMAHKSIGFGVAWGIEPWSREAGIEAQTEPESAKWWNQVNYESIRDQVMDNIERRGLGDYVKIIRAKSREVIPPPTIDLLHIDGAHSDEAIEDVKRWAANVRVGGLCFVDDLNWYGGGVQKAVERLKQMEFRELYFMSTGAMYQKLR